MTYSPVFKEWETRHYYQTRTADADEVEHNAIRYGTTPIEVGIRDEETAGADVMDESIDDSDWAAVDHETETAVSDTHQELIRRSVLLGDAYPFDVTDGSLTYTGSSSGVYEFCLAISVAETITKGEYVDLPRQFEHLSLLLCSSYLGANSDAIHTGWPNTWRRFRTAFEHVHERTGEWLWRPSVALPDDPSTRLVKDGGIDFLVWKNMPDPRTGKLFLLGQCACGNDWDTKLNDIDLKKVQQWFNYPMTRVEPVKAFTTPRHLIDATIHEASTSAGLTFDRTRLTLLAEETPETTRKVREKMGEELQRLAELGLGASPDIR